jgi:glycosyl hydrolase family 123
MTIFVRRATLIAAIVASSLIVSRPSSADESDATVVLDTTGVWRMHHTLRPPVIADGDTLRPVPPGGKNAKRWAAVMAEPTPSAPDRWQQSAFDDSQWVRGPARRACRTPYLSRLCLRGTFRVTDRSAVKGLRLSVGYHGGIVVSVNGTELARHHLSKGTLPVDAVAEAYPEKAFITDDGKLLDARGELATIVPDRFSDEAKRRIASRTRTLDVDIPPEALRPGTNVIGIELVRSPYHKVLDGLRVEQGYKSKDKTHNLSWNTCEIRRVQLTAIEAKGLVPSAVRPQGIQIWASSPLATDYDVDFGDATESQRESPVTVRLAGARNGIVSGKFVVGSDKPIRGLKVTASDLTGGKHPIPASAIRIRYGLPWGVMPQRNRGNFETTPYSVPATPMLTLANAPLAEFPVREKTHVKRTLNKHDIWRILHRDAMDRYVETPNQVTPVAGAVVPVWVTVKIPKDGRGKQVWTGRLNVEVAGKSVASVNLRLEAADYTLPDSRDYRTWVELIQSPETLAIEYGVEPWSDAHVALIAKSFALIRPTGSRVVHVPLIGHTNLGNEESMVRWRRKADGTYEHDFSIMETYLDAAEKHLGKPKLVVFPVWELYVASSDKTGGPRQGQLMNRLARSGKEFNKGPMVTVVDDATGKTETIHLPPYRDSASKALWAPLVAELRKRMARRGIENVMMLGMLTDAWPSKEQVQFWHDIAPGLPWVSASHSRFSKPKSVYGIADVGYQASAFGLAFSYSRSLKGWNLKRLDANFERWGCVPTAPISRWRFIAESSITGNTRGIGRLGADYWPAVRDKRGKRVGTVWHRYPEAHWRVLNIATSLLAPGPTGPAATQRLEVLRENVQECEARIVIEQALDDETTKARLGEDLVGRCEQLLANRQRTMYRSTSFLQIGPGSSLAFAGWRGCGPCVTGSTWLQGSPWQDRSLELFNLAGEVVRKSK